ncbi:MAG TPA: hypothetical protein VFT29_18675 [Gemmatimonadaceae bacterium]|nr:hypothetical protein [Gemmatimonadaceae bacterium]
MRSSITPVVLLTSACVACTEPSPTSPASAATAASRDAAMQRDGTSRALEGSCTLTFDAAPLPPPPIHHQIDTGTCQLTHLGRTEFYGEQDINFMAGTQSGWRTLTAANGDELYITHTGRSMLAGPGLVSFVAQMTIVGGTGRFAGATGGGQGTGLATVSTRTASLTIDATIDY